MPERLHSNAIDPGTDSSERPQDENAAHQGHVVLEERARQIGNSVGRAVVALREARERLHEVTGQTREIAAERMAALKSQAEETRARIGDKAGDIARNMTNKSRQWSETATSAATDLRHATAAKVTEIHSKARAKYYRARLRANQAVREQPLRLVFAAAAAGFLAGVGLRMWRSKHEK